MTEERKKQLREERKNDGRYFKSGKPKKKFMLCRSREYQREVSNINGYCSINNMCGGLRCPLYASGCDDKGRNWD